MTDEARLRLVAAEQKAARPRLAEPRPWNGNLLDNPALHDHLVHFYEHEEFLLNAVAHFAGAGLLAGEPVLIVATAAHREAFAGRLRRKGIPVEAALSAGRLVMLDAQETLVRFMVGDEPRWERFRAAVAPVLERCRASNPGSRVRVYGEMVDLLWKGGNRVAAVRLEELWNELARTEAFSLSCAYAMGNFYKPGDGELPDAACACHSHVVGGTTHRSMETELKERRTLESALRQALQFRARTAAVLEDRNQQDTERFRLLVDSVKDYAIFMLDPTGRVSSWNAGAQRIKGYLAHEIVGHHFSRFYPPEDVGKCDMELEVAAREGRFEDEGWRLRKDGTRFWANVVITRMVDRDGKVIGFAKVTRDLSARRQLEEERVARVAAERALAEQKRTDELREQLIGIVGHDLRTPLSSIVVGAGLMLKRGTLCDPDAKTTARIARAADRMAKIIGQLLDFTRVRLGGGIRVEPRPVDLAELCAEVIAEIEAAHPEVSVRFTASGDSRGLWDRDRLAQVVSNLLANAIQHGETNAPVELRLTGDASAVTLSVHNEGPPITQDLLPKIFDPFRRDATHPARKTEGLGLGLYICREMIRAHGGDISVESSEAAGTVFTVRAPRSARHQEAFAG